jgi:nucleotide-binding universal stress UspA family protein
MGDKTIVVSLGGSAGSAQALVDEVVAASGADGVPVTVEAIAGHPGVILCNAAGGADLLVVGHH